MAYQLCEAGADGLVMFNRFYQPDLNLDKLEVEPSLVFSNSNDMKLALRWVAILYGRIQVDFAITNGVHNYQDVLKGMMAGANVTMMAAELLKHGVGRIGDILSELRTWMEEHEYESITQMGQHEPARRACCLRASQLHEEHNLAPDPSGTGYQARIKS
jgi:dihydroorotate dehydrogenase (fumarate)